MSTDPTRFFTPEEYLRLERQAEFKSEYYCGKVFAMAGASRNHARIVMNIAGELFQQLRRSVCRVYTSDLRVLIPPSGLYTYPDVVVTCGEENLVDNDTLTNPTLIIEVLSPSTQNYDRGQKFQLYRNCRSLAEYVTVFQDSVHVEHWQAKEGGKWLLEETTDPDSFIGFSCIPARLQVSDIYNMLSFDSSRANS